MSVHVPIPTDRPVRVRIAPSPTGDPHVGTAYIGLFNMMFASKHGGKFVLRIEDTDQVRSTPESEQAILDSLSWAGLRWDEGPDVGGDYGPYRQSERREIYGQYAQQLVDAGKAYHCFATSEELAEMRVQAKAEKRPTSYDRRYRDLDSSEVERRLAAGESSVIRLKMPIDGTTTVVDALRGAIEFENTQIDDQVLLKSDGMPTYHLANVVDDFLMKITHVIRAEEWISSTPKHVRLYEAFGWEAPTFIHMPLLRNNDRSKISKRKNPVSLDYYRRVGILPEALLNFLGRMGWSMPDESEKFTLDEMRQNFTFERVSLSGPIFDIEKLTWLNGLYIREMNEDQLVDRLEGWLVNRDFLKTLAPLIQERIDRLDQFLDSTTYFFGPTTSLDAEALIPKKLDKKTTYRMVKALVEKVDNIRRWDRETIEAMLREHAENDQWGMREVFMTTRLIVTGRKATPGLFETMEVVGKSLCQARFRHAMLTLRP
jgi:glutamyl-tRNA synthetase